MLIVGLGNPDKRYENTYHNVGFMVIDALLNVLGQKMKNDECKSKDVVIYKGDEKIVIAKPMTYMNLSGEAVRELAGKYKVDCTDIIIIYDDIDLDCGALRIRKEGSAGTHNGMRSIISLMGGGNIPRVRVGIGRPTPPMQLADYVLSKVSGDNKVLLEERVVSIASHLASYINHRDIDKFMREAMQK